MTLIGVVRTEKPSQRRAKNKMRTKKTKNKKKIASSTTTALRLRNAQLILLKIKKKSLPLSTAWTSPTFQYRILCLVLLQMPHCRKLKTPFDH